MAAVITLTGWSELQHYKDRDPPWIKLHRKLLSSESWVLGTDTSRLVQVASMMLAPRYGNHIPYDWDLLKKVSHLDCSEQQFRAAVLHLVRYKFLEIQEVTGEEEALVQTASSVLAKCSSEKRREETEESRGEKTVKAAAPPTRERGAKPNGHASEPEWFTQFRMLYPPRSGDQPKAAALRAANARLTEGHTTGEFLDGARRYATFCAATGKANTEYVQQWARFLGPQKSFLQPWTLPASKADARLSSNLSAADEFMRRTEVS